MQRFGIIQLKQPIKKMECLRVPGIYLQDLRQPNIAPPTKNTTDFEPLDLEGSDLVKLDPWEIEIIRFG